jgi:hypothetical protein
MWELLLIIALIVVIYHVYQRLVVRPVIKGHVKPEFQPVVEELKK